MSPISFCQTWLKKHPRLGSRVPLLLHAVLGPAVFIRSLKLLWDLLHYWPWIRQKCAPTPRGRLTGSFLFLRLEISGVLPDWLQDWCGFFIIPRLLWRSDSRAISQAHGAVGPVLHRRKGNVWTENGIKKKRERRDECDNMAISLRKVDCDTCSSSTITLCWYCPIQQCLSAWCVPFHISNGPK